MELDMQVKIEVKDKKFDGTLREIVKINADNLMEEFCEHPSKYAWFATLCEICSAEAETKEFAIDVLRANLDEEKRNNFKNENVKTTEAMVTAAILTDKRYKVLKEELIEVNKQHGILKAIAKSLDHRKDMLIQLGSTKRQEEMLGDFNLKKIREHN